MNVYPAGNVVTLAIDLADALDVFDVVDGGSYSLQSQTGETLIPSTALPAVTDGILVLQIDAEFNQLPVDVVRALRSVQLVLTSTGSGAGATATLYRSFEYVIEADVVLIPGTNSFVTYGDAVMIGYDIPALEGWNNVGKSTRISALLHAKRMIGRLSFQDEGSSEVVTGIDSATWATLSHGLKEALARAQVIEANQVCGGDPVIEYRRRGVQSITVGESKNFLQTWKPADERIMSERGISPDAVRELKPYLASSRIRIRRG